VRDRKIRKHYNGTINRTIYGNLCQRWDSNTPHEHNRNDPSMFPDDASIYDAGNYCRDPHGNGKYYHLITRSMCIILILFFK
jgi:apolipoprotein a